MFFESLYFDKSEQPSVVKLSIQKQQFRSFMEQLQLRNEEKVLS